MDKKTLFKVISLVLCIAVAAFAVFPVIGSARKEPENPLQSDGRQLYVISGGEDGSFTPDADSGDRADAGVDDTGEEQSEDAEAQPEDNTQPPEEQQKENTAQPQPDNTQPPQPDDTTVPDESLESDPSQEPAEELSQGGDAELDLSAVLTWYKYGTTKNTVLCLPEQSVGRTVTLSQLADGEFRYSIQLEGTDKAASRLTLVTLQNSAVEPQGSAYFELPDNRDSTGYTFVASAETEVTGDDGKTETVESRFTFIITYKDGLDLSLKLDIQKADGSITGAETAANTTVSKSLKSSQLKDGKLEYSFSFSGLSADNTRMTSVTYAGDAGSGVMEPDSGTLLLEIPGGRGSVTYTITANAAYTEGGITKAVTFVFLLTYMEDFDLGLNMTWYKKGVTAVTVACTCNERTAFSVKHNQLTGGSFAYEFALTGDSARRSTIESVKIVDTGGAVMGNSTGSVNMSIPAGVSGSTYTFTVTAAVAAEEGAAATKTVTFTYVVTYTDDVSLQMRYSTDSGDYQYKCENRRTVNTDIVYTDELREDMLSFTFSLVGDETAGITLNTVSCYQSGSGRTKTLAENAGGASYSGQIRLLTNNSRAGENQFTVTACDSEGTEYSFTFNLSYLPRGDKEVVIQTNLTDGQEIQNEAVIDLTVEAWSRETDGTVISHIRATGAETRLTVTLDGVELAYTGASGYVQQYRLYAENPPSGDTNTHTLTISARDEYGNEGELTLTLKGQRCNDGKKIGTAWIYIDMTCLGLGRVGPVTYDVLSNEPVSYSIAKAVWGYDAGDPFGKADSTFGWNASACSYSGTLDIGFYLKSLGDGSDLGAAATAFRGESFAAYGSEEAVLAEIDRQLGAGSNLAVLWRCIYRNGIVLTGAPTMSIGEFDFTRGSGWLYSLNGTFYPGSSMCDYFLKDGDTLTLRYTLAYGWDVGSGQSGYGDNVGYCISCLNGAFSVDHQYERVSQPDGSTKYVCRCCGMEAECPHEHTVVRDSGEGTCGTWCEDCMKYISQPTPHQWEYTRTDSADTHTAVCVHCGCTEEQPHEPESGEDTATCTQGGRIHSVCTVCGMEIDQDTPPLGHTGSGQWGYDGQNHYQDCTRCHEHIPESTGTHRWVYSPEDEDWRCAVCGVWHNWDLCDVCIDDLTLISDEDGKKTYYCACCGQYLIIYE